MDDKDANDEDIERMQLDADDRDDSSLSDDDNHRGTHDASDSDSVLSDANSDVNSNSDANDTEAETERLYDTPQHQRQRDVVVDQFNEGQVFEHTPSKLRTTAARDDENKEDNESLSGDDGSIPSSPGDIGESPSKPATTQDTSVDDETRRDSLERKRKRSPVAGPSDSDQPMRKRTGSVVAPDNEGDEEDATSANLLNGDRSPGEGHPASPLRPDDVPEDEAPERETRSTKKITRNGSKRRGPSADEPDEEVDREAEPQDDAIEDDVEQNDEDADADADAEEEADAAAKNLEECKCRGT